MLTAAGLLRGNFVAVWLASLAASTGSLACDRGNPETAPAVASVTSALVAPRVPNGTPAVPAAQAGATGAGEVLPWAKRSGTGFPCEVETVLAMSCRRCHWDPQEHDAPFAMKTWQNVQGKRDGKPIYQLMKADARRRPHATHGCVGETPCSAPGSRAEIRLGTLAGGGGSTLASGLPDKVTTDPRRPPHQGSGRRVYWPCVARQWVRLQRPS